ncbi:hypothetical protein A3J90_03050 [candidate division WOR-1 bacterium RIFOXYC2_FULL_37_10]|uniref:Uncharacterized protein n=1 Tax=candidate division WOR-1 bacterium RIFOXYB2_FULL_37_13 TaxID=1802579 RepID=A0A1F4SVF8_UNCSA|nr:MAG: hypothetical protein A2246_03170 [candidate division WOR-1 bacterium RIFOXYA2_FULL_37_7]OGC24422.1 MAG: hypothetical protein A2310_08440 [candidate division WOR-1 bacterium RIFOXYB2_FULL_37_13]OGC37445.1 MAG: hypothetical protein A3J90_03050 [candidate division WOR-1 bacterium RIFOXYC2_FULL_37_10]
MAIRKKIVIAIFMLFVIAVSSFGEEVISKGDAIDIISAAKFVRQKIGNLFSWTKGYDLSAINKIKLVPSIKYVKVVPKRIPPDGRTVLELYALIDDPEGPTNIKGVRADLENIGKLKEATLVDTGLWGDQVAGDNIYSLQSNVSPNISLGDKEISVKAINKNGWLALSKTTIIVDKSPQIIELNIYPKTVKAGAETPITITAKVISPYEKIGIKEVFADLRSLALGENVKLIKKNYNEFSLNAIVPSIVKRGEKSLTIYAINNDGNIGEKNIVLNVTP